MRGKRPEKEDDLKTAQTGVVDAAGVSSGLWVSYLFAWFYLFVAAAGVTHADLFMEHPVRLPFLNVDLPLKAFFWLGPLLFLIVHAYVLLHFVILAGKIGAFDARLRAEIDYIPERTRRRQQLPNNIFVQFLAGPQEVRDGIVGMLLKLIAWISLVIGPVALLVFFELQFLPYHDASVTWWQRFAVLIDTWLLWRLWPSIVGSDAFEWRWFSLRARTADVMASVGAVALLLVFVFATFPGEWLDTQLEGRRPEWLHRSLVAGAVNWATRKRESLSSNSLVLPGFDVFDYSKFDEAKIADHAETAPFRARHLEGAVLINANLRKTDFTAANLDGANLDGADLREAKFECAGTLERVLNWPHFLFISDGTEVCADLNRALLPGARLQGAFLISAQLRGAVLSQAHLEGAHLKSGQTSGCRFNISNN